MNSINYSVKGEKYIVINKAVHLDTWVSLADLWVRLFSMACIPSLLAYRDTQLCHHEFL